MRTKNTIEIIWRQTGNSIKLIQMVDLIQLSAQKLLTFDF